MERSVHANVQNSGPIGLVGSSVVPMSLRDDQFHRWTRLLERRTGVVLASPKKDFLAANLRLRMRELGLTDFDHYYSMVEEGAKAAVEWSLLIDRLSVQNAAFFRHLPSFACVAEWLDERFTQDCSISAWSVGCSTGEEAYSLAMQIEYCAQNSGRKVLYGVSGTDVSQMSLHVARKALYSHVKGKEIPLQIRERFTRSINPEHFEINESLRRRVAFSPFNLMEIERATVKPFDLIYCQNVLTYFSRNRQHALLESFARLLSPGGLLIVGLGEVNNVSIPTLVRAEYRNVLGFHKNDVLKSHVVLQ